MSFEENNTKALNQDEQMSCKGQLTKEEWLQALKSTESDKTPGSDGLPLNSTNYFGMTCLTTLWTRLTSHTTQDNYLKLKDAGSLN